MTLSFDAVFPMYFQSVRPVSLVVHPRGDQPGPILRDPPPALHERRRQARQDHAHLRLAVQRRRLTSSGNFKPLLHSTNNRNFEHI